MVALHFLFISVLWPIKKQMEIISYAVIYWSGIRLTKFSFEFDSQISMRWAHNFVNATWNLKLANLLSVVREKSKNRMRRQVERNKTCEIFFISMRILSRLSESHSPFIFTPQIAILHFLHKWRANSSTFKRILWVDCHLNAYEQCWLNWNGFKVLIRLH